MTPKLTVCPPSSDDFRTSFGWSASFRISLRCCRFSTIFFARTRRRFVVVSSFDISSWRSQRCASRPRDDMPTYSDVSFPLNLRTRVEVQELPARETTSTPAETWVWKKLGESDQVLPRSNKGFLIFFSVHLFCSYFLRSGSSIPSIPSSFWLLN